MIATFIAALVPLIVGFIWYNPKVVGNIWMKENGFTEEYLQANFKPLKVFGLSLLFAVMISFIFNAVVIHQNSFNSLLADEKRLTPELIASLKSLKESTKDLYRTFGHGAFHGVIFAIFVVLPIIGTNALFEKRSAKYVLVHVGYWLVTLALMGGIICQWGEV